MDHDSPDPSSLDKLGRAFPKEIRIAFLICIGLFLYLTKTEIGLLDWKLIGALATAILYLVVAFFSERRSRPKKEIFWTELFKIASKYGDVETDQEKEAWLSLGSAWRESGTDELHVEISERHSHSFFSYIKRARRLHPGGGGFDVLEEPALIYVSEVSPEDVHTRWWKGLTHRVGYYTRPDGTVYEWYTAKVRQFLKNNQPPKTLKV